MASSPSCCCFAGTRFPRLGLYVFEHNSLHAVPHITNNNCKGHAPICLSLHNHPGSGSLKVSSSTPITTCSSREPLKVLLLVGSSLCGRHDKAYACFVHASFRKHTVAAENATAIPPCYSCCCQPEDVYAFPTGSMQSLGTLLLLLLPVP